MADSYVTDTHALLWYLAGSQRLGDAARKAFDEAVSGEAAVVVPVIALAELAMLMEKGRASISMDDVLQVLRETDGFVIEPLVWDTVSRIQEMSSLFDMHDRLITAEALIRGVPLITVDQAIVASGLVPVVW
ncbi:MAG: type II toxin-antitoxin system VapC family toxin [Anaerolineae bacterium]|nr:type II toxin-antitoxin system VapC family toxin [Anaerolineae bacterium]